MKTRRSESAYTLIELLMVMAVVTTLFSAMIPGLLDARKSAYVSAAVETLRTITVAEETYRSRNLGGNGTYGTLAQLEAQNLMAWPTMGNHFKNGYTFLDLLVPPTSAQWGVITTPDILLHGDRNYLVTNDGYIRAELTTDPVPGTIAAAQALAIYQ